MFSNFEDAFLKKNEMNKRIPKEILMSLSETLPEGFEYTHVGDGACSIISSAPEMDLELKIEIPNGWIEEFNISTVEELMEFIYRTQKQLKVIPDDEGCITINGIKFNLKDTIKYPLKDVTVSESQWYIKPQPFQPPYKIPIEGNGMKKYLTIQRQPYADMHKSLFKSIDDSVLEISYMLDEKNNKINFKFNINIEKSKNVKNIVEGLKLYQSCLEGKMKFGDIDFSKFVDEDKGIKKTIEFWSKVSEIEDKLDVEFILEFPITINDAIWIEKLYRSFIEEKPYKEYIDIDKITTNVSSEFNKEDIINIEEVLFGFTQNSELDIWGVKLNMYECICLFDLKVIDIVCSNEKLYEYQLILESTTEKGIYQSIRYFLTKEDATEYKEYVDELKNAQEISIE